MNTAKKPDYRKTYWCHRGKHEALKNELQARVPVSGEVPNADKNPALEKFRKASNCYYDLYNNGLCNRAAEFRAVFGFSADGDFTQYVVNQTEAEMNKIILAAAKEQGIKK